MFSVANAQQRWGALGLALSAGVFLALGFIPVSLELVDTVVAPFLPGRARILAWTGAAAFPFLAWLFYLSFPRPRKRFPGIANPWLSLPVPIALSAIYGLLRSEPGIFALPRSPETELAIAWVLIFAPLGEELLFRGWIYSLADKLAQGRLATATNPLPLAVWVSAGAFSVWHLQNWAIETPAHVVFQAAYTIPVGLWLGWLRARTGGLTAPIAAHMAINLAAAAF